MHTVLVTGAEGQLGRQVIRKSADQEVEVVGLSRLDLDITDLAAVRKRIAEPVTVINCAAYTAVDRAETDADAAYSINETGAANLARACAEVGARLIHVSTDYVFSGTSERPYEPDDPTGPKTVYGASKLAGERAIAELAPTSTIVRTAWVYTGVGTDFVATMRRLEAERDVVRVVTDQVGSPTYAADLADGLLELAELAEAPLILHATNDGATSWYEFARAIFAEIGADPDRVQPTTSAEFVRPAPRPAYSVLSSRAWGAVGLTPLRGWREALHASLAG
ncbi:MAG: dTDP-4-dehydrorhamnose reductase [Nocardiaceae bacterium]|nr:dTDP-4-dehydrorhamnose reductase [Nocardiaceae bacterium]